MINVLRVGALSDDALGSLFAGWQIGVLRVAPHAAIEGSFWGEPEAGIVAGELIVRDDTPVHSALHEGGHLICLEARPLAPCRAEVTRDAGSDDAEECAVCYLQALLADALDGYSRQQLFADMDAWGYSFRLGSARAWFETDADDARAWLLRAGLVRSRAAPARKRAKNLSGQPMELELR